jgi:carbamoyltransferase
MFDFVHSPHMPHPDSLPVVQDPVVLGLNVTTGGYYSHNASAALIRNGKILSLCDQERLDRVKDSGSFPARAAQTCLEAAGIDISVVDAVAVGTDPLFVAMRTNRQSDLSVVETVWLRLHHQFGRVPPILLLVGHHLAHAASAFYPSGFSDALVISWDGGGDNQSTVAYRGNANGLDQIAEYPFSLGNLYNKFRKFLNLSDKGSLMGLASYGVKEAGLLDGYVDLDGLKVHPALQFARGREFLTDPELLARLGTPRLADEPIGERHVTVAAQAQHAVERLCRGVVEEARILYPSPRLCLAGGVALNATFNGMLWREGLFEDLFIQPNAPDGGLSLGAALEGARRLSGRVPHNGRMSHVFYGPSFTSDLVEKTIRLCRLPARRVGSEEMLFTEVAGALERGAVVGWFQGRMEWGPRALGNRSILADPRSKAMADKVNDLIKYRDEWRPFALSILAEHADDYLVKAYPDPFMLTTAPVKPGRAERIPAVVHADGTTRPQFVYRDTNPRYWGLLECFRQRTGVPGILNTSFNVKGEPIVCSPLDAIRTFASSGLDMLVLGEWILEKEPQPPVTRRACASHES